MMAKGAAAKKESGDAVEQLVWAAVLNSMLEWMRTERRPDEQLN
jgi:hypothetical protein